MHFLSIESSTQNFAVSIAKGAKVLRFRNVKVNKVLEDSIVPSVEKLLVSAKVKLNQVDAFAVGLGPGSFTSLRVGLSTLKAFAMATGKPMVGIGSLDVIAQGALALAKKNKCEQICVITDARRNLIYSALYAVTAKGFKLEGEYQLTSIDAALDRVHGRTLFVGDALSLHKAHIQKAYAECIAGCKAFFAPTSLWLPQAKPLSELAWERLSAGKTDDAAKLLPVYLYAPDCQVSKK